MSINDLPKVLSVPGSAPFPSSIQVAMANIILLPIFLIIGYWVFRGALGWGDSLDLFKSVQSPSAFVAYWYDTVNGRLSQALVSAIVGSLFRTPDSTPESFPWWAFRALSLFCTVMAPVNFSAALARAARLNWIGAIFVLFFMWAVWSSSPVVYYNSAWFTFAEFVGYSLPTYLVSAFSLICASSCFSISRWRWVPFALFYLFLSLFNEQLLATTPILAIGLALTHPSTGRFWHARAFSISLTVLPLSMLAAAIYLSSPAQTARNLTLRAAPPDLSPSALYGWFSESIPAIYKMLIPSLGEYGFKPEPLIAFFHAFVIALTLAGLSHVRKNIRASLNSGTVSEHRALYALGVMGVTFLVAYMASMSTMLVARYFPGYAGGYPAILLAVGGIATTLFLSHLALRECYVRRPRWVSVVAGSMMMAGLLSAVWFVTLPNIGTIRVVIADVGRNTAIRRLYYRRILDYHSATGQERYVLTNCPLTQMFSWTVDPPWGLVAYFKWHGHPEIRVVLESSDDYRNRTKDEAYVVIACEQT